MRIAPGAMFEWPVEVGTTGLVGTLSVKIDDGTGTTVTGPTTSGVIELQTSGTYVATLVAPSTSGQYVLLASTDGTYGPNTVVSDDLTVTASAIVDTTGAVYATRDQLKAALMLVGQTYADADIDRACQSASRAIDNVCGRIFYSATETRYYTPDPRDRALDIIDIQTVSAFTVDTAGNSTFSTTWTAGTDFDLEPFNAGLRGRPYELVRLRWNVGRAWPCYQRSVKVAGTFGWAAIPDPVSQYAIILASKLLKRTREAPFGILSYGLDAPIATRIARTDPDFEFLLGDYVKATLAV